MAIAAHTAEDTGPNDRMATPMAVIAGLSHNMVVGTIFGSFSVLLASVQMRMGVPLSKAALGIPLVIISSSLSSPWVGGLATRHSLRLLMVLGAVMVGLGFVALAFTASYGAYIAVYFFLFGPALSLAGSVGPITLITRWFSRNRGLALGLAHLSIVVAILPVLCNWMIEAHGPRATYLMLAAMVGIGLIPFLLMVRDFPPNSAPAPGSATLSSEPNPGLLTASQIMCRAAFWQIALLNALIITGAMTLAAILVPIVTSWHHTSAQAAMIASTMSVAGMAGSVLFGWLADRIGGFRGLALVAFDCAILWFCLLTDPSLPMLVVIISLLGLHGTGAVPNASRAIASAFGRDNFSRAFGLATMMALPFAVVSIVGSSAIYERTGSYNIAIIAMGVCLLLVTPLGLRAARAASQ